MSLLKQGSTRMAFGAGIALTRGWSNLPHRNSSFYSAKLKNRTFGSFWKNARAARSWPDGNLYVAGDENAVILRFNGFTGAFMDAFVPAHPYASSVFAAGLGIWTGWASLRTCRSAAASGRDTKLMWSRIGSCAMTAPQEL